MKCAGVAIDRVDVGNDAPGGSCRAGCKPRSDAPQHFPRRGPLAENLNRPLADLRRRVGSETGDVYCYVISTIARREERFVQYGTAPNMQGGLVTLCTCKHMMRTFRTIEDWPDTWIAGFTDVAAGNGHNALVYLMRVGHAFASHRDLWASPAIAMVTKRAKAADVHRFGDLFTPIGSLDKPYDPRSYRRPTPEHDHAHGNNWHGDVSYFDRNNRPAALLVGDPARSFLWDRPRLAIPSRLGRGQRRLDLAALLGSLEAWPLPW